MWESIRSILSYKIKEIEFRIQTWKRSREISRAYEVSPSKKPVVLKPFLIKTGKIALSAAVLFLMVFGIIKVIPLLPVMAAPSSTTEKEDVDEDISEAPEETVREEPTVESSDTNRVSPTQPEVIPAAVPLTEKTFVELIPGCIPNQDFSNYLIVADKGAKILHLLKREANVWKVYKDYEMATGEQSGRKETAGDKRTPEGIYFITGRKEKSELSSVYGPVAFVLDYPNERDRSENRTGQGIWIHGSDKISTPPDFTAGCLALANHDISELSGFLANGISTPVIILAGTEKLTDIDFTKLISKQRKNHEFYTGQKKQFEDLIMRWKTAWESKDIDTYSSFYSTGNFLEGNQRWSAFRERKTRTFAMYKEINIEISNITLAELTDSAATVKFLQIYTTNLNRMENGKKLVFEKVNGSWKISRESTVPKEELLL